jgi:hypothetical protein
MQKEKSMIDKVLQFFKSQTGKIAIIAFVLGLLFGWLAIGWGIWPVTWTDAGFADLQEDYAQLAMKNAINGYAATADEIVAQQTYLGFGETADEIYQKVKESGEVSPKALANFEAMLGGDNANPPMVDEDEDIVVEEETSEEVAAEVPETDEEVGVTDTEEQPAPDNKALRRIGTFLGILFVVALIVGLALVYIFLIPEDLKKTIRALLSSGKPPEPTTDEEAPGESPAFLSFMGTENESSYGIDSDLPNTPIESEAPKRSAGASTPRRSPIERTVNYVHNDAGHSHLDQNFSLKDNDDSGKTILEYGIAMSDYVEIGGITYALAFDVYLASHPERRTITRVMVNKDLLNHPEVLQRYEGKGEPIKIARDLPFQLETAKFQLNGYIVNADYVFDEKYGGNYIRALEVDLLVHYL